MYDIIVIGGGPAGLTAAIYGRRQNKTVLVLEKNSFGGQTVFSPKIENYPGYNEISGIELSDKLVEQALYQGADLEPTEALSVSVNDGIKTVHTDSGDFECKALILAIGAKHRLLGLENEEELIGNGISFCALCDGAFYKDKEVAVIGGGNSALQEAVLLSDGCKKVTVIQNLAFLTGETKLAEILQNKPNVEILYNTVVSELISDGVLKAIKLKNTKNGIESVLNLDGMFIAIGLVPDTAFANGLVMLDDRGYVLSGEDTLTDIDGIFAAGDCRTKRVRQIATAVADGASAALAACNYIENN